MVKALELTQGDLMLERDEREALQDLLTKMNEEISVVKRELAAAREQLKADHLAFIRGREEKVAVELVRDSKRLDLKAIDAELEAKREALVRMETEQVVPMEAKMVLLNKEASKLDLQMAALREQHETKAAEISRMDAALSAMSNEMRILENNAIDLRRKAIFLTEQVEEKTALLRILDGDLRAKDLLIRDALCASPALPGPASQTDRQGKESAVPDAIVPHQESAELTNCDTIPLQDVLVTVLNGSGLVRKDLQNGECHLYVVLRMGAQVKRTRMLHGVAEPLWNETFCFRLSHQELEFILSDSVQSLAERMTHSGVLRFTDELVGALAKGPVQRWVPVGDSNGGVHVILQAAVPGVKELPTANQCGSPAELPQGVPHLPPQQLSSPMTPPIPIKAEAVSPAKVERAATASSATPAPNPATKHSEGSSLPPSPASSQYVDFAEATSREPSLHFKEPDLKFLHIRLYEGVVPIMDFDGLCDPFLFVDTGFMQWKSEIAKETLTPVWEQEVVLACYNTQNIDQWNLKLPSELRSDTLNMTVYNWNPAHDRRIGFIRLKLHDIPGFLGDEIVEPPAPHWFEADRHFGVLTLLVSSDAGKWVTSLMFDKMMKKKAKEQRSKIEFIRNLQSGLKNATDALGAGAQGLTTQFKNVGAVVDPEDLMKGQGPSINPKSEFQAQRKDRHRDPEKTEEEAAADGDGTEATEKDEDAEEALKHAHEMCSIKAQIWFDNTYTALPLPIVGQLYFRLHHIELERRDFGQPRSPLVILNYNRHWVRLPTVFGNVHSVFDQEFTFGVTEPAAVMTVAVFDDISDRLIGSEPKFLGLLRIRPCCLSTNTWHRACLPIYQRFKGRVRLRGRITLSACLQMRSALPIMVAMFKPPLKDLAYYQPLNAFKSDFHPDKPIDFETPIRVVQYDQLFKILAEQDNGVLTFRPEAVKKVVSRPVADLDLDMLNANFKRVVECFRMLVRFADYLDYICLWTSFRESLAVNVLLVLLICYIEWAPTFLLLWLLVSFLKGLIKRAKGAVIAPMESDLFGEVVDGLGGAKGDDPDDEDEAQAKTKNDDADTSAWEEIRALVQMAIRVQEAAGDVASIVERIQAMPRFMDPRVSGLLSVAFAVLIPGLYYVPLKFVMSFAVLFVLRHPVLRDPIPPPPVNLVGRLPSRSELLLPRQSGNVMGLGF
eukprot:GGOE01053003.1.p1 GENE.GGOE01053003.1~~GGOE01053003.1.p1  ORF type:complete len:1357 (-),score=412.39 GGOE01053003.1:1686-5219(-)